MNKVMLWRHCLKSLYGRAFRGLTFLNEVCWRVQPKLIPYSKRLCRVCQQSCSRSAVTVTQHPLGLLQATVQGYGSLARPHAYRRDTVWFWQGVVCGCIFNLLDKFLILKIRNMLMQMWKRGTLGKRNVFIISEDSTNQEIIWFICIACSFHLPRSCLKC